MEKEKNNMTYEEKIIRILGNKLEYNGDNQKAIEEVKIWLHCEWSCNLIFTEEYEELKEKIDQIAERMIREL